MLLHDKCISGCTHLKTALMSRGCCGAAYQAEGEDVTAAPLSSPFAAGTACSGSALVLWLLESIAAMLSASLWPPGIGFSVTACINKPMHIFDRALYVCYAA